MSEQLVINRTDIPQLVYKLDWCWSIVKNKPWVLTVDKKRFLPSYIDLVKSVDVNVEEKSKFFIFEGNKFSQLNLIRLAWLYKGTFIKTHEHLFEKEFSLRSMYYSIILNPKFWITNFKNFGGYSSIDKHVRFLDYNAFVNKFNDFANYNSSLFNYYSNKVMCLEKQKAIITVLKNLDYEAAKIKVSLFLQDSGRPDIYQQFKENMI